MSTRHESDVYRAWFEDFGKGEGCVLVWEYGPSGAATLSAGLGLSKAIVGGILRAMLETGFVQRSIVHGEYELTMAGDNLRAKLERSAA